MKVRHASSLVTLIIVLRALPVAAQDYPAKPVRLIVNTAAGGLMDVAARVTADHLGKALGQRFIIENRPGSGGNIGTDAVAKAELDGYPNMPFDPFLDIAPVAPLSSSAILIVANAKLPANNLTELVALAKERPAKLSYGSAGPGTAPHLAGEMFKTQAGVDTLHVPYRGAGPAVNLIGKQVQAA